MIRFPVPELSEAQRRLPWYHPSLRPEVLHITLSHLTLTSTLLPHHPHNPSVYDAYFTRANGIYTLHCMYTLHVHWYTLHTYYGNHINNVYATHFSLPSVQCS